MVSVSALGAITALVVAIGLILKKVPPAYGMIVGALVGGLVGGAGLSECFKVFGSRFARLVVPMELAL